ncbi:MAG TPA: Ppx/GppA family phosphatase [Verrucomicrobiota bacterium]|nr:Ppx/GppA family phosphatase [Verrucomicrobiota bacterium]
MSQARRAVIDVGTNSVKLLVADVDKNVVLPVLEVSKQTRLGRGFYETRRLQPDTIETTAQVVATFANTASELGALSVRVIATSAARDAVNPDDLTTAIHAACGLRVEIISGEQEADWAFRGVTTDPALAKIPLLLLDVGGGSTEFILGQGEQKHFRQSFNLGTVRLLEQFPHDDPPLSKQLADCRGWLKDFLQKQVRPAIEPAMNRESRLDPRHREVQLVGTGGTTSILAKMELRMDDFDRDRIEAVRLGLGVVRGQTEHLWRLPIEERRKIAGLPPKRADVILMGAAIFEAVMEEFHFDELRVSTRGLRYAALME